jgi:hypothetical protein
LGDVDGSGFKLGHYLPFLIFTRLAQLPWLYQGFNFTVV